jgi:phosphinothricin acetyltransferase
VSADLRVRAGVENDLPAINALYNHYVRETHVTFDIEPITDSARREWFHHYSQTGPHRVFVACSADQLIGYATSSPYRPRKGYETSIETSVYLALDAVGRGTGTALYETLFDAINGQDLHRAYAGIALPNDVSLALHKRFGFQQVAHFTEQGREFDRFWDVVFLERVL